MLIAYIAFGGLLAAAIASHVRLSKATSQVESLYATLYGFKYRIRETEDDIQGMLSALRYEVNPEAAPKGGCGSGGCGSGGGGHDHGHEHGHDHGHDHGQSQVKMPKGLIQIT